MLSASGFQGVQVCCMPRGPSIPHQFEKPTVVLTDFAGFFEGARTLLLEAAKVVLNVRDVDLKVASDDVGIVPGRLRIAWDERSDRGETGFCVACDRNEQKQCYRLHTHPSTQPQVSETPIFLDRRQWPCLEFE